MKMLHSSVLTNEIPAGKCAPTNKHLKKAAITLVQLFNHNTSMYTT